MSAAKKRKIDDEGRVFNSEWCTKYLVVPHNKGVICLICQTTIAVMKEYNVKRHYTTKHSTQFDEVVGQARLDTIEHLKNSIEKQQCVLPTYKKNSEVVTKLSYKLCECMAEKGKSYSDGEFIKNCLTIFTEYACPEKKHLVEKTSLSRFTVSRRTKDLSDNIKETLKERLKSCDAFSLALGESTDRSDTPQLVIFIRAVTAGFDIVEEFLDMASLSITGQDVCEQVLKVVEKFELNPAKLCGVTTDGAPSMTDRTTGLTKEFLNAVGAQDVVVSHCIIHQENLCTKVLDFAEVMRNVVQCVNYIRARGLYQFKAFLDELDSEYPDAVYFSAVCSLSRAAALKRFWNLRLEIKFFMESKHQNVAFLSDENWLNDLAFLTDITQHLSDLNLQLQSKDQLVNKLFEHVCAFEKKLELFQAQLSRGTLTHFTCLFTRKLEYPDLDCTNYAGCVQKLRDELANRYPNFRQNEIKLKLFAQPFDLSVKDCLNNCQMELIELQANMDIKRKYQESSLVDFYKLCVCEKFPNLCHHARRMTSLFGSTYCCEQFFSKMKLAKARSKIQLTEEHLTSQLRVATTSVKADIDKLCKDSKFQVSH